mgnify:CR=1 FL=1
MSVNDIITAPIDLRFKVFEVISRLRWMFMQEGSWVDKPRVKGCGQLANRRATLIDVGLSILFVNGEKGVNVGVPRDELCC